MQNTLIDRRNNLSLSEFIEEYAIPQKPVVLTNAAKHWPAMQKWTFDFLRENYGSCQVKVLVCQPLSKLSTHKSYRAYKSSKKSFIKMSLKDYIDYLQKGDDERLLYLIDWHLHFLSGTQKLRSDYQTPIYFANSGTFKTPMDQIFRWIYIGKKGTYSRVHLDVFDTSAWNATISGKKRWIFYPPETKAFKETMDINVLFPDYNVHPFLKENRMECITSPGDVIYTPSLWYHAVENLETGISFTHNYIDKWNYKFVKQNLAQQKWYQRIFILPMLNANASKVKDKAIL